MFHLITGGSGSGKSAYAESEICRLREESQSTGLYYIATMFPNDSETLCKIKRHQDLRKGNAFHTLECYIGLQRLAFEMRESFARESACVLLECMSNLTANELYMDGGAGELAEQEILQGIGVLQESCAHLVVVTNEVFSDGPVSAEMERYLEVLGRINCEMADRADRVTEVVYGIPVCIKGIPKGHTEIHALRAGN